MKIINAFYLTNTEEIILLVLIENGIGEQILAVDAIKKINRINNRHGIEAIKRGSFYHSVEHLKLLKMVESNWEFIEYSNSKNHSLSITKEGINKINAIKRYRFEMEVGYTQTREEREAQ